MQQYRVTDPSTGVVVSDYHTASDTEIAAALTAAGNAFGATEPLDRATRASKIARVAELHLERAEHLAAIIAQEMGKPIEQAQGEVEFSAEIYQYYADEAAGHLVDEVIPNEGGGRAFVRRVGVGVVLGIMPWNFPYYQVARFAAPNLILGNTVLLKHAEQCPRSAEAIAEIYRDAGFGNAFINVRASHAQIEGIIADPRVQGVSLTGSERAGTAVAEIAGRHLKKVVLELGGSDVFLVLDTSDIDSVVALAVEGRIENSGQACNGSKRIVVLDRYYDEFAEKFVSAMEAVTSGPATDTGINIGPLSSVRAAELLGGQVARAVQQGATLHLGATEAEGAFFPPTVLSGVTPEMSAYREELFGPAAVLYRVQDDDAAIALANSSPYGLGSIVICEDLDRAVAVGDRLEVGMVFINGVGLDAPHLPFGGVKRSGFGRELGRYALEEFANKKLFVFAE